MRRLIIVALTCALVMFATAHAQAAEGAAAKSGAIDPIRMPSDKSDWAASKPEMVGGIPFRTVRPEISVDYGKKRLIAVGLGNVKRLYFLVSSGGDLVRGRLVGTFTMTRESGRKSVLRVVVGKNTYYRKGEFGRPRSKAGNHRISWVNRRPRDAILTITFEGKDRKGGTETRCEGITAQAAAGGFTVVSSEKMAEALKPKQAPLVKAPTAPIKLAGDSSDWNKSKPEIVGGVPFRTVSRPITVSSGKSAQIPVGLGNVKALYFLVSSGGDLPRGKEIARLTMLYESGREEILGLVPGLTTYYRSHELRGFPRSRMGNYMIPWRNPHPDDSIVMITFEGTDEKGCETRCEGITAVGGAGGFKEVPAEKVRAAVEAKRREEDEKW